MPAGRQTHSRMTSSAGPVHAGVAAVAGVGQIGVRSRSWALVRAAYAAPARSSSRPGSAGLGKCAAAARRPALVQSRRRGRPGRLRCGITHAGLPGGGSASGRSCRSTSARTTPVQVPSAPGSANRAASCSIWPRSSASACIGEPQRAAVQVDLPAAARTLGLVCRRDVHRGGLQHRSEERGGFLRVGVVAGRLGLRGRVNPLDLAAGQRPVLGNLDQSRLLQLAEVVVEAVSGSPAQPASCRADRGASNSHPSSRMRSGSASALCIPCQDLRGAPVWDGPGLCRTILHSLEFITVHCARQRPGHREGIGDCIAALDDQDAVRACARAASGPGQHADLGHVSPSPAEEHQRSTPSRPPVAELDTVHAGQRHPGIVPPVRWARQPR